MLVVQPAELLECRLLPHLPLRALDELEHPDVETDVPRPQRHSERRRRLALACTGMHRQHGHVAPGPGGQAVVGDLQRITLWHQRLCRAAHGPRQIIGVQLLQSRGLGTELASQLTGQPQAHIRRLAVHHHRGRALGD